MALGSLPSPKEPHSLRVDRLILAQIDDGANLVRPGIVTRVGAVEQTSTEISSMVASHSGLLQNLGETIARISEVTRAGVEAMTTIVEANSLSVSRAGQGASGAKLLDERISSLQVEANQFARRLRSA